MTIIMAIKNDMMMTKDDYNNEDEDTNQFWFFFPVGSRIAYKMTTTGNIFKIFFLLVSGAFMTGGTRTADPQLWASRPASMRSGKRQNTAKK